MPPVSDRKAIVVTYPDPFRLREARALAEVVGFQVAEVFTQKFLSRSRHGVGSGKAAEIATAAKEHEVDAVIFDERLKPVQLYNLAKMAGVEVIDREKLILEIFSRRAATTEAKLQVHLAELRYEMARAREKVRLAKTGEQPGFFGLGRYEVEVYRRDILKRLSNIARKLEEVSQRRDLYRRQRTRMNMPTVSLSGYTAAGKTTLFNALTGEAKETGSGAFTTLGTTTRSLLLEGTKVLLSDTVGFITDLPLYMIEAFKSTLEELRHAALVLLLVDASEPPQDVGRRFMESVRTLNELQVSPSRVLVVLNKVDLSTPDHIATTRRTLGLTSEGSVVVSARTGQGLSELQGRIHSLISEQNESRITIPASDVPRTSADIDWLRTHASVEMHPREDGGLEVRIRGPSWIIDRFRTIVSRTEDPDD